MAQAIRIELDDRDLEDAVHENIPVVVPYLDADGEQGEEEFLGRGDLPFGVLFDLEDGRPGALFGLFSAAFYDDDNDRDENDEPIPGTSSLERWRKLEHDKERHVPGGALRRLLEALGAEYMSRGGMRNSPARPTTRVGPSREQRRATGRGSTAGRRARASISPAPEQG